MINTTLSKNKNKFTALLLILAVSFSLFNFSGIALQNTKAIASSNAINIWWPTNNVSVKGSQPFKAQLNGMAVESYNMYWQVDGGQLNFMSNNYTNYPHKEAAVDLSGWNWKGSGPYVINFVAKDFNGNIISQQSANIFVVNNSTPNNSPTTSSTPTPVPTAVLAAQPAPTPTPAPPTNIQINNWWPVANANMSGVQPFKAEIDGMDINSYSIYWQVDGGQLNLMNNNSTDSMHKESEVDLSGWNWKGSGPYVINFVAKNSAGGIIAQKSISIYVNGNGGGATNTTVVSSAVQPTVQATPVTPPTTTTTASNTGNPFAGQKLWVNPNSDAANYIKDPNNSAANKQAIQKIANGADTGWFSTDWVSNMTQAVQSYVQQAVSTGAMPTMVLYDIPDRDCGQYSAGGAASTSAYQQIVNNFAAGIGSAKTAVILEPDALPLMDCLSSSDQQQRESLIKYAVQKLESLGNTAVYIDIGHSGWLDPQTAASRLAAAGVQYANGFSLNVSNFETTSDSENYGQQINTALSQLGINGKHFVIDTSRNGSGSNGQWCNPNTATLGNMPTGNTGNSMVDAFLWVKTPGESDGTCNGGPSAGTFWPQYALQLAQ